MSLAPALLISMPQLTDPNFSRAVVLLCQHSPEQGAFGLVVNRPLVTSGRVVVNLDPPVSTDRELHLWVGGPVEPQRSWMLLGDDFAVDDPSTRTEVASGVYLSTAPDLLRRALEPQPPARLRIVVGCSGWAPGQLEEELKGFAWLLSDVDAQLIFDTPAERMWEAAIRRLGADPSTLQASRGVH